METTDDGSAVVLPETPTKAVDVSQGSACLCHANCAHTETLMPVATATRHLGARARVKGGKACAIPCTMLVLLQMRSVRVRSVPEYCSTCRLHLLSAVCCGAKNVALLYRSPFSSRCDLT